MPGRRSTHEDRQKRQMRHAVASGEDMPPLGFKDRSRYFKEQGRATDEIAYWAGPVTERPEPWNDPRRRPRGQPPQHSPSQPYPEQRGKREQELEKPPPRKQQRQRRRQHRQHKTLARRRRPSSAANITVLSMLDFERKAGMQQSSSVPSLRHKRRSRPSTAGVSSRRAHSASARALSHHTTRPLTVQSTSRLGGSSSANTAGAHTHKTLEQPQNHKHPLSEDSIASSLLSETSLVLESNNNKKKDKSEETPNSASPTPTKLVQSGEVEGQERIARKRSSLEWATQFIADVKDRLEGEEALFEEFVRAVQQGDGSIGSLLGITKALLVGHDDLYLCLQNFVRQSTSNNDSAALRYSPNAQNQGRHVVGRRGHKTRSFTWLLDVAKTDAPTVLSRSTLDRLSRTRAKPTLKDVDVFAPVDPSKKATGRYQGSGGGRFSTAFPMSDLERKILHASRLPGPLDYQNPAKHQQMAGGRFSTAYPKSDVDWTIYRSKQRPGPLDYRPRRVRKDIGVKFSDSNPKSYLDWAIYNSQQVPGPLRYDISKCL